MQRVWLLLAALLLSPLLQAQVCVTDSVQVQDVSSSGVTSVSFSNPGSQVGDLLLVQVAVADDGVNVTAPSGWVAYSSVGLGGNKGVFQGLFYRVAAASEASTYAFGWSGAARATGGLLVLRGVELSDGVPVLSMQSSSGSGATLLAPSVMVSQANSRVLRFFAFGNGNDAINPPALVHYSSATTQAGPNGVVAAASSLLQANTGASGTASATAGGNSDEWVAATLVARADPDGSASCGGAAIDHYRLTFASNQGLTCNPLEVLVSACQNSACSQLYAGAVSLAPVPLNGWSGATSFTGGSSVLQFRRTSPGSVTLGMGGSPAASNPVQCLVAGVLGSCTVTFADSGFILDIPNLLAAKPTAASIQAVKKDDQTQACVPGFASGSRTLQFSRLYSDPDTGTQPVLVNGTSVTTDTALTLDFDSNARAALLVRYDDAGLMTLNASYSGSGQDAGLYMSGSDSFVSKPYGLLLETDADSGCTADINCPLYPGGVRAGDPFSLRVKAVAWQNDGEALTAAALADNLVTPNFRLSNISLSSQVQAPAGGSNGVLGPNSSYDHALGSQTTLSRSISEVGVFRLTATPASNAYFAETVSGGSSDPVGRFIPAYLGATGSASLAPACGSLFSYQGQPIGFAAGQEPQLAVTGYNRQGGVTYNYDRGAFWRLDEPVREDYLSVTGRASLDASGRLESQGTVALTQEGADDGDGMRSWRWRDEQLLYKPASSPLPDDLPFGALIRQGFSATELTDLDGACVGTGSACQGFSYDFTGSEVRLGRLSIGNAHGSELQPLALALRLESWQGVTTGSFQLEGLDSCTAPLLGNPQLSGFSGNLSLGDTTPSLGTPALLAGAGLLTLSAPGDGNDGSVLAGLATAADCGVGSMNCLPDWLWYDWNGNGREPARGLATFGIYKGAAPLIFRRELYRP